MFAEHAAPAASAPAASTRPAGVPDDLILFGAAYYAEYQQSDRTERDLDLMVEAGFTVIRVGESVWSTWEPRDGEFELDWLQPVLDGAHERGIAVILGTPTYAVPPWLQKKHPEIAADIATDTPMPWGGRQEVDYSHPVFRDYAERIIRQVVERYATHPAVIGYQVDNEPGMLLFHNAHVFARFVETLKQKYGTVENLNEQWGLVYWSHRIADWSELWMPDGNTLPQYDLAWRRFQADLTTEFIAWQAAIVREYATEAQFVTTCIAYPRPALNDEHLTRALDVTAGNPYYGMQDHLIKGLALEPIQPWTSTGVAGLYRQADRTFSSKQQRFLVTETNAQTIAGADQNYPPYPGQLMQAALAFVSRGAAQIEYWHWHSLPWGTETYWGGVLPHSLSPGRVYREVAEIGRALKAIGPALVGFEPDADVAVIWSTDSRFAFEFMPPLHTTDNAPDRAAYQRIFDAFYGGVIDAGAQARVIHPEQLDGMTAPELAARFGVLVAPAFSTATDAQLALLADYAAHGGHLIVGPRTAYGDDEARARVAVAPDRLHAAAGAWYDEFSNLQTDLALKPGPAGTRAAALMLSPDARATAWADGLCPGDPSATGPAGETEAVAADVLATYDHPELGRFAAITTRTHGEGRVTLVGTVPNAALAADLVRFAVAAPVAGEWLDAASGDVNALTVASGTVSSGPGRAWFVHNWGRGTVTVRAPFDVTDLISGSVIAAGTELTLQPWSVFALAGSAPR